VEWCEVSALHVKGNSTKANLQNSTFKDNGIEPSSYQHTCALIVHEHATATLSHCSVQRTRHGVYVADAHLTAISSDLLHCKQGALRIEDKAQVELDKCTVDDVPEGNGLRVSGVGTEVTAHACKFQHCGITGASQPSGTVYLPVPVLTF
jgi:hypothetical protein